MESFVPQPQAQFRPDDPFNQRWELLKPHLERLYIDEKHTLPDLVQIMKSQYGFDANESQYKYQFNKKWGWKKSIPASKKEAVCEIGQTRAVLGKSMVVKYKGKIVDPKKLRRHAKDAARKEIALKAAPDRAGSQQSGSFGFVPFSNRIFLNWNMPYGALSLSRSRNTDYPSPFAPSVSTPSDISVDTPPGNAALSPQNPPSPLSTALKRKTAIDRAHLFVQGRHDDLIRSMNNAERRTTSTWLYQFWLFSFTTAKYWGRGPRNWTADKLGFNRNQEPASLPSPNMIGSSPDTAMDYQSTVNSVPKPSPLCRWSIHVRSEEEYESIPSPPHEEEYSDPQEEPIWTDWPESWKQPPFEERLRNGLENNDFSSLNAEQLPLAVSHVAKAAQRSPNELLEEALGFSIMGRNYDLTSDLVEKARDSKVDVSELYPFHLATSYLDGSKSCCNILHRLCNRLPIRTRYINKFGHTVLDNLMITILKGHASTVPGVVDDAWKGEKRFPGEEVDICGRWDADSECFRTLLASGKPSVPFEWKHKFCHTSVQALCHCIDTLAFWGGSVLSKPSGLFLKYCTNCGQKLQLLPLHTLVLTAFQLAQFGCEDEDLFGMLACLLCLLNHGADPLLTAQISIAALLGAEQTNDCSHEELTPVELVEKVYMASTESDTWSKKATTWWQIFYYVLRNAQVEWAKRNVQGVDRDDTFANSENHLRHSYVEHHERFCEAGEERNRFYKYFGMNKYLGHIWAAVQTELLTYRRLEDGDSWNSENFDMDALLSSLEGRTEISIGLVQKQMMKPYCACGRFRDRFCKPLREDAAAYYFSNLDNWNRTTFIEDLDI